MVYQRWHEDYFELLEKALDRGLIRTEGEYGDCSDEDLLSRRYKAEHSWAFGATWKDAVRMATNDGWPEGLDTIKEISSEIEEVLGSTIVTSQSYHDVCGGAVDIGAFMTGEPECFVCMEEDQRDGHGKIINLGIQVAISCGTSARTVEVRGAAVIAFMDLLELAGYQVNLLLVSTLGRCETHIEDLCHIKQAGRVLDPGRMAFVLAHPAFARRIMIALAEQRAKRIRREIGITRGGSYGWPGSPSLSGYDLDLMIPNLIYDQHHFVSVESAQAWVLESLKAQGVMLKEEHNAA